MTALSAFDSMSTATWPGVWPCDGISATSGVSCADGSTKVRQSGVNDRPHRVREHNGSVEHRVHTLVVVGMPLPMAVLLVDEVIGGVRECRPPRAVHEMGVPADVVDM